jgi:hypothetical protein
MTKSDVSSIDISLALDDVLCKDCRDAVCDGCLVLSAVLQIEWLETQRMQTAKERGDK